MKTEHWIIGVLTLHAILTTWKLWSVRHASDDAFWRGFDEGRESVPR